MLNRFFLLSKSKPNLNCIYHFSADEEANGIPCMIEYQSKNCMYDLIPG